MPDVPQYDETTQYKGYTIRRFPFLTSGGGAVGGATVDVTYYHFHVFENVDASNPVHELASIELAHAYIDNR